MFVLGGVALNSVLFLTQNSTFRRFFFGFPKIQPKSRCKTRCRLAAVDGCGVSTSRHRSTEKTSELFCKPLKPNKKRAQKVIILKLQGVKLPNLLKELTRKQHPTIHLPSRLHRKRTPSSELTTPIPHQRWWTPWTMESGFWRPEISWNSAKKSYENNLCR